MGRLAGVAVLTGAMIVVAGAPVAATDAPCDPRRVSVSDDVVMEGGPAGGRQLSFVLTTTGCATGTVDYATGLATSSLGAPAIAPSDYSATSGTVGWTKYGSSSVTISVPIVGDEWVEMDEYLTLVLRDPSANMTITDGVGVGTIRNDDLTYVGADSEPDCGMTGVFTCEFDLELTRRVAYEVTVAYATSNGTASAGHDFVGVPSGAVVFPAGATRATARVTLLSGTLTSPKYFYVDLTGTSAGSLSLSRIRLTILGP